MLERIKLKSRSFGVSEFRSPGVTESRSFLVRYRRTYVLKKNILELLLLKNWQIELFLFPFKLSIILSIYKPSYLPHYLFRNTIINFLSSYPYFYRGVDLAVYLFISRYKSNYLSFHLSRNKNVTIQLTWSYPEEVTSHTLPCGST